MKQDIYVVKSTAKKAFEAFNERKQIITVWILFLERTMPAAFDNGSWIVCNQYIIPWFFQALLQSAVVSVPDLERS